MYLKSLFLKNFRNFEESEAQFSKGLNVFYGQNAQGKTNLLEAIYLLSTGRSFRSQTLKELIRNGEASFLLEAEVVRDGVTQHIKVFYDGNTKRLQMDGNEYQTFHPLLGMLPIVLYTPYDIELISGSPSERRRFLNLHLAQSDPLYVHHLTCFWRAMKQRNCLLKVKSTDGIECWEMQMAHSAEYIVQMRKQMLDDLKAPLLELSEHLSKEKEKLELTLNISSGKDYLRQLKKNRPKEMDMGQTLTGPHRDDMALFIDASLARTFASEGQKKTMIAALKFAEWQRLSNRVGAPVLMGFDDLSQNLDDARLALLKGRLKQLGQVFITTPHPPDEDVHQLQIQKGSLS